MVFVMHTLAVMKIAAAPRTPALGLVPGEIAAGRRVPTSPSAKPDRLHGFIRKALLGLPLF
jgi:hypothetical protein